MTTPVGSRNYLYASHHHVKSPPEQQEDTSTNTKRSSHDDVDKNKPYDSPSQNPFFDEEKSKISSSSTTTTTTTAYSNFSPSPRSIITNKDMRSISTHRSSKRNTNNNSKKEKNVNHKSNSYNSSLFVTEKVAKELFAPKQRKEHHRSTPVKNNNHLGSSRKAQSYYDKRKQTPKSNSTSRDTSLDMMTSLTKEKEDDRRRNKVGLLSSTDEEDDYYEELVKKLSSSSHRQHAGVVTPPKRRTNIPRAVSPDPPTYRYESSSSNSNRFDSGPNDQEDDDSYFAWLDEQGKDYDDDYDTLYRNENLNESSFRNNSAAFTSSSSKPSRNTASLTEQKVYIASSLNGKCFHSSSTCYGLRNAYGVKAVSLKNANTMGMRACRVCKPNTDMIFSSPSISASASHYGLKDSSQQQQKQSIDKYTTANHRNSLAQHHDQDVVLRRKSTTTTLPLSTQSVLETESKQVYIASSLNGKCFHSSSTCYGLRSAHGVRTVTLQNANIMGMRACRLCQSNTEQLQQFQQLQQHGSSSSYKNNIITKNINPYTNTNTTTTTMTRTCTYWTTPSGQCYHLSRSCSSLRRSKSIMDHNDCPIGKRPCKLCS